MIKYCVMVWMKGGGRGCGGVVSLFLFPLLLRRPSGWGYGSARVEAPIWKLLLVGRLVLLVKLSKIRNRNAQLIVNGFWVTMDAVARRSYHHRGISFCRQV